MEILFFLQDKTYTGTTRVNANKNNMLITGRSDTQRATINMNNRDKAFDITGSNVTLRHINFVNGKAPESGGAISCYAPNIKIQYCNFNNNTATEGAGAIGISGYNVNITNCRFTNNRALGQKPNESGAGGAIAAFSNSNAVLRINNCVFINNSAATFGGAISSRQTLIITGSTFNSNFVRGSASSIGFGGAISTWSITTISNSVFNSNSAVNNGGAISARNTLTLTNSKFNNNKANYGGAIFTNSTLSIVNPSFTNNFAGTRISITLPQGVGYNSTLVRVTLTQNNNIVNAIWKEGNGAVRIDSKTPTISNRYATQKVYLVYNGKTYSGTTKSNGEVVISVPTGTINSKFTYRFDAKFNRAQYPSNAAPFITKAQITKKYVNSYWNKPQKVITTKIYYKQNKTGFYQKIVKKGKTSYKKISKIPKLVKTTLKKSYWTKQNTKTKKYEKTKIKPVLKKGKTIEFCLITRKESKKLTPYSNSNIVIHTHKNNKKVTYNKLWIKENTSIYLKMDPNLERKINKLGKKKMMRGLNKTQWNALLASRGTNGKLIVNKKIRNLSNKIISKVRGKLTIWKKVNALDQWMKNKKNMRYTGYSGSKYGNLKVYAWGKANCADHAHLMNSLCRAAGIHARYVHAHGDPGHLWSDIYVDGSKSFKYGKYRSKKGWVWTDTSSNKGWKLGGYVTQKYGVPVIKNALNF